MNPDENSQPMADEPAPISGAENTPTESTNPVPSPAEPVVSPTPAPAPEPAAAAPAETPVSPPPTTNDTPSIVVGDHTGDTQTTPVSSTPIAPGTPTKKRPMKALLMALIAVVVLAGGSAAAYVGVVLPNKPQNVLKDAIVNSLQQTQVSFNGTVQASPTSSGGLAVKVALNGQSNSTAKATDLQLNITVSGITFPVEARLVGGNAYFKLGDVSSLVSLINSYSPQAGAIAQSLGAQLSNQWFVVDSTLIDESPQASCLLNTNLALSKADIQQLENMYSKSQFVTIKSTSSDTVGGLKVEKMNLAINNAKAGTYAQGLNSLSLVKAVDKCTNSSNKATSIKPSSGETDLTVWVNKADKQIVQISGQSGTGGISKSTAGEKLTFTVDVNYKPVTISAPAGAKPVTDLLSSLQSVFGGSSL